MNGPVGVLLDGLTAAGQPWRRDPDLTSPAFWTDCPVCLEAEVLIVERHLGHDTTHTVVAELICPNWCDEQTIASTILTPVDLRRAA